MSEVDLIVLISTRGKSNNGSLTGFVFRKCSTTPIFQKARFSGRLNYEVFVSINKQRFLPIGWCSAEILVEYIQQENLPPHCLPSIFAVVSMSSPSVFMVFEATAR